MSFWVILRRLNFIFRRFGTLCSIFIGPWRWNRVFRNVGIFNLDARESPRRKHKTKYYLLFKNYTHMHPLEFQQWQPQAKFRIKCHSRLAVGNRTKNGPRREMSWCNSYRLISGVYKFQADKCFQSKSYFLLVLGMELEFCKFSGPYNFELVDRFLWAFCTLGIYTLLFYLTQQPLPPSDKGLLIIEDSRSH